MILEFFFFSLRIVKFDVFLIAVFLLREENIIMIILIINFNRKLIYSKRRRSVIKFLNSSIVKFCSSFKR